MHVSRLAVVVLATQLACDATTRAPSGGTASTSAPLTSIPPPGPAAIGTTEALIAGTDGLEGFWPLNDVVSPIPLPFGLSTMSDVGPNHFDGYWSYGSNDLEPVLGPLARDSSTAASFRGDDAYGHVDSHKVLSLTRTWDYFDQGPVPLGRTWGSNFRNELWVVEAGAGEYYGVDSGFAPNNPNDGVAYIDPRGVTDAFQQGIESTTLDHGEMQILSTWDFAPANASGDLAPVALVAQEIDVNNQVRAALIEHLADHTMELDIVQTVAGQETLLGSAPLPAVNRPGNWWFVRFQFDGANYGARAWRWGDIEPSTWQAMGSASSFQDGSTAVRYDNSSASYQPVVHYDDFWVQTLGFTYAMFVNIPSAHQSDTPNAYPGGKAVDVGQYEGFPGDAFAKRSGSNGSQEYLLRLDYDAGGGDVTYELKGYAFNPEGGFGAGRNIAGSFTKDAGRVQEVSYDKWYFVVSKLDPGDFNDTNAGIRVLGNGMEYKDHYRGDESCRNSCQSTGSGNDTTCFGIPSGHPGFVDNCWMVTPLAENGELAVGRTQASSVSFRDRYFDGTVADMAVFSRELTCDEVSTIFNSACLTQDAPIPSGLYATASSSQPPFSAANAVDGSLATGWTSGSGGIQTFTVDLGQARDLAMIQLQWGAAFAMAYEVQISTDGATWTAIGAVPGLTNEKCLAHPVPNGDGATDAVCIQANARYVRLFLANSSANDGLYTLQEVQVFACDVAPAACVNNYPIAVVPPQRVVFAGETLALDGSNSFDMDGNNDVISYAWSLAGPSGSTATLSSTTTAATSFTPSVAGTYAATLVVTDLGYPSYDTRTDIQCPFPNGLCPASSYPATTVIDVMPVLSFVPQQLTNATAYVAQLGPGDVTTLGNQQAFGNLLKEAQAAVTAGKYDIAIQKVQSAIERTDGWSLRGAPDAHEPGRDWIVGQAAAMSLYSSLTETLAALQTL